MSIEFKQGDITRENVDAIVNASNYTLVAGGGVDLAIHMAAGPELTHECAIMQGCPTGEARITKGYNLPAKHVIHTVGPVYGYENGREEGLLERCYRNSLELAKKHFIKTIAFPCVSTGTFLFPRAEAAKIATAVAQKYSNEFEKIILVCFLRLDYYIYKSLLE